MAGRRNPTHRARLADRRRKRRMEMESPPDFHLIEWNRMVEESFKPKWRAFAEAVKVFEGRADVKAAYARILEFKTSTATT